MLSPIPSVLTIAALLLCTSVGAAEQSKAAEEPPLRFELGIGDTKTAIAEGEKKDVSVNGQEMQVSLRMLPTRLFEKAGIRFEYPSQHSWEYESEDSDLWTLDGSTNVLIILHVPIAGQSAEMMRGMADDMTKTYGNSVQKRAAVNHRFGKYTARGTRLSVTMAGQKLRQDIVGVDVDEHSFVFVVQDSTDDNGAQSAETTRVLELLEKTFQQSGHAKALKP